MENQIQILDTLRTIRGARQTFLPKAPGGLAEQLLSLIFQDMLALRVPGFTIERIDKWCVVGSQFDWLACEADALPEEIFYRLIDSPEFGPNWFRAEPVVRAFSSVLFTLDGQDMHVLTEETPPEPIVASARNMNLRRVIAFLPLLEQ